MEVGHWQERPAREDTAVKTSVHFAFAALALFAGIASDAAAGSGPLEARNMLDTAVRALETDQTRALEMFNSGHPAYKQADLYVYCADARGTILAHGLPQLIGQDLATLKDKTGKEFGLQLLNEARQGRIGFAAYFLPKPNGTDEIYKEDYFTKVGKLTCGVGYYSTKTE
jgi:signal transduction histidine kinase